MTFNKYSLPDQLRTNGTRIFKQGRQVLINTGKAVYNRPVVKNTIKREVLRAKKSKRKRYPGNLGIFHKDVNNLTDF